MWRLVLFSVVVLCTSLTFAQLQPTRNEGRIAQMKALPPPLSTHDECLYVSCTNAVTSQLRWPVLKFAEKVRHSFEASYEPLGSQTSPLAIVLGAETNGVKTIERRTQRLSADLSHLIIFVPDPNAVDLEVLRVGIVEALLRERAKSVGGSYAALTWPAWMIQAMADLSRGREWKAEAYETLFQCEQRGELPAIETFFDNTMVPSREIAAFFAQWFWDDFRAKKGTADAFLQVPWRAAQLDVNAQVQWETYVKGLRLTVFVPGELTYPQLLRWHMNIVPVTHAKAAADAAQKLTMSTLGRPAVLKDLTQLYMQWYLAIVQGKSEATQQSLFVAAEAAYKNLEATLQKKGRLEMEESKETQHE